LLLFVNIEKEIDGWMPRGGKGESRVVLQVN
jgi:hypothetical protein